MNWRHALETFPADLYEALVYPFESWGGTLGLVGVTFATYVLLVMSTMPEFALQMLGDGLHWFEFVVVSLTENIYETDGWAGLGAIVLYAWLTGVAVVVAVGQLQIGSSSGVASLTGVAPALAASGCASCGAGLLAFLGFAGGISLLPFDGALLRVGGLLLLVYFIGRAGHPERCRLEPPSRA